MKLFNSDRSVDELRLQLAETKRAQASAQGAVAAAEAAFDDAGDSATAKALSKARDVLLEATEHVARAERLVKAGEERATARKREEQEALFDELSQKTTEEAAAEAGRKFGEEEADLVIRLAIIRAKRKQVRDALRALEVQRDGVGRSLGYDVTSAQTWGQMPDGRIVFFPTAADAAASPDIVRRRLADRIAQCRNGDPLIPFLYSSEPKRADYAPTNTYFSNE